MLVTAQGEREREREREREGGGQVVIDAIVPPFILSEPQTHLKGGQSTDNCVKTSDPLVPWFGYNFLAFLNIFIHFKLLHPSSALAGL